MALTEDKIQKALQLEASGQLTSRQKIALDGARAAGLVPAIEGQQEDPGFSFGNMVGNIPKDAANIWEGLKALSPVGFDEQGKAQPQFEGLNAMTDLFTGLLQKPVDMATEFMGRELEPDSQGRILSKEVADPFIDQEIERIKHPLRTLENEPVQSFLDVLGVASLGAGGAIKGVSGARKAATSARKAGSTKTANILEGTANVVEKVSEKTLKRIAQMEPGNAAVALAKFMKNAPGEFAATALGTTTGAGRRAFKTAARGGESFKKALRGEISGDVIVDAAAQSLVQMKDIRRTEYLNKLSQLNKADTPLPNAKRVVDNELRNLLNDNKITLKADGKLDFGPRVKDPLQQVQIQGIVDDLLEYGDEPHHLTVIGLDDLKAGLSDRGAGGISEVFSSRLRDTITKELGDAIPEYRSMVREYAKATDLIKDIEKSFSLGGKSGSDTILKKLTRSAKDNEEFRRALLQKMDEVSGENIVELASGNLLSEIAPRGLVGRGVAGLEFFNFVTAADPTFLALMLTSSPRVMSEFVTAFSPIFKAHDVVAGSKVMKGLSKAQKATTGARIGVGAAAGRVDKEMERTNRIREGLTPTQVRP